VNFGQWDASTNTNWVNWVPESSEIQGAEGGYKGDYCIGCVWVHGTMYGQSISKIFQSFADWADYATTQAALPQNQIYVIFAAMCANQGCDPNQVYSELTYAYKNLVYNVTSRGTTVDQSNLDGYWEDPLTWFHNQSWESGYLFDVIHLIQDVGKPMSGHDDPFGAFNPLHYLIQIPSMLLPAGASGSASCSLNGGCTLGP
jgi:hypothetical protein